MISLNRIIKDKILWIAIGASLFFHLFWVIAVKIVQPTPSTPVHFSKVSFLGPILDRGAIQAPPESRELAYLQKRFLGLIKVSSQNQSGVSLRNVLDATDLPDDAPVFKSELDKSIEREMPEPEINYE